MQAEAGGGPGVVGDGGAAVGIEGGVGFAGGDDSDAAGGKQGAEANAERQGGCFLLLSAGEAAARIVAAMRGIEDDDVA
jgi:hypothetical protein